MINEIKEEYDFNCCRNKAIDSAAFTAENF